MLDPEVILEGLTAPQREAASTVDGPLLVLAGAGSGKTRTITRRVAYMAACGIPAWNILALTFTNKAAGEMRERIGKLLGGEASGSAGPGGSGGRMGRGPTVATFHSLCARLLREYAELAGLPKTFSIFDSADQSKIIKQAIKAAGISPDNFQPAAVISAISSAKNKLRNAAAYSSAAAGFFEKNVARVYTKYEALLLQNNAVDFDDLLLKIAVMLRDNAEARRLLQDRFQYILIDEYQDTNHAQFVIAHMLAMNHKNICATGDPDQSIYGWRGANLNNILEFEQYYPKAKVVLLEQNYRSTKNILKAASALISKNTKRKKKDLWTENQTGPLITLMRMADEHQEAAEIVRRIGRMREQEKLSWDQFAIFYRTNSLSRVLEDALMKAGVPYQIARGTEFYARKEIKDVIAYLKVIANPADNVSLARIINVPARSLGDTSLTRIEAFAGEHGINMLEALAGADEIEGLTPRAVNACKKLADLFIQWRALTAPGGDGPGGAASAGVAKIKAASSVTAAGDPQNDPLFDSSLAQALEEAEDLSEGISGENVTVHAAALVPQGRISIRALMEAVIRDSGMEAEMRKQKDDPEQERLGNVNELITVAAEFDSQNPAGILDDYLQQVTLVSDVDKIQDAGGAVTLMTLHAAKGLEFPFVAIAGMEDGLIPHARAIGFSASPDELEEERRLAFVGITRAMKHLLLSHARYRTIRGMQERAVPSQFFKEMPDDVFDEIDLTGQNDAIGSIGYRDEAGYARRAAQRSAEAREQRQDAVRVAGDFQRGMLVRHPQFGLGRIEDISPAGTMTKAQVQFQGGGRKTLILQYARLEKVDA